MKACLLFDTVLYTMRIKLSRWVDYSKEDQLTKILIDFVSKSNNVYFDINEHALQNRFIHKEYKKPIITCLTKAFRNRYIVMKILRQWIHKYRNLPYLNDTDFQLEPFDNTQKYPEIVDKKGIHRFSSGDIYNMIISKVVYSEYQMPRILKIKNPWTNEILTKTQLYNLYVSSYKQYKTPWLLTEYLKS